jgi:D-alanine transfer protein
MKNRIGEFVKFHLAPAALSVVVICILMYIFSAYGPKQIKGTTIISGQQQRIRATFANCEEGNQAEIDLAGAFKNKRMLTVLGSSELGSDAYSPYYFLSDSLNLPTMGYGHAYHQSFSMYCELLAMGDLIDGSRICVLISPGWFATEGTNIEAFLEFVRPNFLKSIAHNSNINMADKLEIGRYIYENIDQIDQPGPTIRYFSNLYAVRGNTFLRSFVEGIKNTTSSIEYDITLPSIPARQPNDIDWEAKKKILQEDFVSDVSNPVYVRDDYYKEHLQTEEGKLRIPDPTVLEPSSDNRELADFKLLVALLKKHNVKASFVIQPLNPYYYNDLEKYNEIVSSVLQTIDQHNYPYLNMFVTKKNEYEPGTLRDIMHLGDYGWLKIDQFLWKEYGL